MVVVVLLVVVGVVVMLVVVGTASVILNTKGITQVDKFPKLAVMLHIKGKPLLSVCTNSWFVSIADCENCVNTCPVALTN